MSLSYHACGKGGGQSSAGRLHVHVYDLAHQVDTDAAIAFFNENL